MKFYFRFREILGLAYSFNAWVILKGLETLGLGTSASRSAVAVGEFMEQRVAKKGGIYFTQVCLATPCTSFANNKWMQLAQFFPF